MVFYYIFFFIDFILVIVHDLLLFILGFLFDMVTTRTRNENVIMINDGVPCSNTK